MQLAAYSADKVGRRADKGPQCRFFGIAGGVTNVPRPCAFLLPREGLGHDPRGTSSCLGGKCQRWSGTLVAWQPSTRVVRPTQMVTRVDTGLNSPGKTIHFEGRLLSSNISELNRPAHRTPRNTAGSGRKTLISRAGDFFALRWALIDIAPCRGAAGGAS